MFSHKPVAHRAAPSKTRIATLSAAALSIALLGSGCGVEAAGDDADQPAGQPAYLPALVDSTKIWGWGASINVCFEDDGMDQEKHWVRSAVHSSWASASSVRFLGWEKCTKTDTQGLRIKLQDARGSSFVGTDARGVVDGVKLNTWASGLCNSTFTREDCVRSTAVHEFGHALGFIHEQNRDDTPVDCTEPDDGFKGDTTVGDWDIESVTNYCNPIRNGRGLLSFNDVRAVQKFYGPDGWAASPVIFDYDFYVRYHKDVAEALGGDRSAVIAHWLSYGLPKEGRRGSPGFDVQYYLAHHPDLLNAFGDHLADAALHWRDLGLKAEGRRGAFEFDVQWYLQNWSDLESAFGNDFEAAYLHWPEYGISERRSGSENFGLAFYAESNADLKNAFGDDSLAYLIHWLEYGMSEGRRGNF